jgi:hypothetical protein
MSYSYEFYLPLFNQAGLQYDLIRDHMKGGNILMRNVYTSLKIDYAREFISLFGFYLDALGDLYLALERLENFTEIMSVKSFKANLLALLEETDMLSKTGLDNSPPSLVLARIKDLGEGEHERYLAEIAQLEDLRNRVSLIYPKFSELREKI